MGQEKSCLVADIDEAVIGGRLVVQALVDVGGGHGGVIRVLSARRGHRSTFGRGTSGHEGLRRVVGHCVHVPVLLGVGRAVVTSAAATEGVAHLTPLWSGRVSSE